MDQNLRFLKRKSGKVLIYNGYQFYKHTVYKNTRTRWICSRKKKDKCPGAITVHGENIEKIIEHAAECLPDEARNMVALALDDVKARAAITTEPIPVIFKEVMAPLYDMGLDKVTKISYESSKTSIYAKRKQEFKVKKLIYNNIQDVEIPAKFMSFLKADYYSDGRRVMVFYTEYFKQLLENMDEYYGDGTFRSTPVPFSQLYTLHGNFKSTSETTNIVPLIYCLMSDKTEQSYIVLFELLKTQCPEWNPKVFHCDFETAATNALRKVFPTIKIVRCYYHYINSVWRKAKCLGLKAKMYRRIVGLCTALPLLPVDCMYEGWNYIQSECNEMLKLKPFMHYMNTYWFKNEQFVKEWCVYNQLHRTNNFAEGWHARINRTINKNYVTIAKLLSVLEKDASINKMKTCNATSDHSQRNRSILQKDRDAFILNAQMKLIHRQITVGHFLEQVR